MDLDAAIYRAGQRVVDLMMSRTPPMVTVIYRTAIPFVPRYW